MIRAFVLLMCSAAFAAAAPIPKELRKEASREGAWKLVKIDLPGGGQSTGMTHNWVLNAKDEVIFRGPQEHSDEIRFRLAFDPKTKHLDFLRGAEVHKGLYEHEGDSLKLSINFSGGDRPKDVSPTNGSYTYHFQRVKDTK